MKRHLSQGFVNPSSVGGSNSRTNMGEPDLRPDIKIMHSTPVREELFTHARDYKTTLKRKLGPSQQRIPYPTFTTRPSAEGSSTRSGWTTPNKSGRWSALPHLPMNQRRNPESPILAIILLRLGRCRRGQTTETGRTRGKTFSGTNAIWPSPFSKSLTGD